MQAILSGQNSLLPLFFGHSTVNPNYVERGARAFGAGKRDITPQEVTYLTAAIAQQNVEAVKVLLQQPGIDLGRKVPFLEQCRTWRSLGDTCARSYTYSDFAKIYGNTEIRELLNDHHAP